MFKSMGLYSEKMVESFVPHMWRLSKVLSIGEPNPPDRTH